MKREEDEFNKVLAVVAENKTLFALCGVGLILAGIVAIGFPLFASLTLNYMIGVVLFAGGLMTLLGSFTVRGTGPFFGFFLTGAVTVGIGLFLINNPLLGTVVVTLGAGFVFLMSGAYQISVAMELSDHKMGFLLWVPAAVNVALGLVIISGVLEGRPVLIGVAVGINFMATGASMILVANAVNEPAT